MAGMEVCSGLDVQATAWLRRPRWLQQRVGICLASAGVLALLYVTGAFLGFATAPQAVRPSVDGSWAGEQVGSRWAKFQVRGVGLVLAMVLASCIAYCAAGISSSSSAISSRKFAALLLICCVIGCELPSAEALSEAVVQHNDVLARSSLDMNGATVEESQHSLMSNDSASKVSVNLASDGRRHLLSDIGGAPSQMPTQLLETFTDADQSPTLSPEYEKQEEAIEKLGDNMERKLRASEKRSKEMNAKIKKLDEMITEQVSGVSQSVEEENKKLTDEIKDVPPVQGAPGPPGMRGADGKNGINGIHGLPGEQGPQGKKGVHGVRGPTGVEGPLGPQGPEGVPGFTGTQGPEGVIGVIGPKGVMGPGSMWKGAGYFCPEGYTGTMRLVDCSIKGCRLETKFENEWGTVCSNGFNDQDAVTLCKAFGFPEGGVAVPNLGGGKGVIWLDDINCEGAEGDVGDCRHAPWLENNCVHAEDVGLCCYGGRPTEFPDVRKGPSFFPRCPGVSSPDMRLVDCNREVCRLEVKHENQWGTVCDNGFTDTSALTVCKLLGYPKGKFKQMCSTEGKFGSCADNRKGSGPIWLDEVVCNGFERDLEGCRHRPWGEHKCTHKQDVGVCCAGDKGDVYMPGKCRGGELYYKFNENLESSTGGPDLAAPWGIKFAGVEGVRFIEGQGLGVDPNGCLGTDVYTLYLKVKLDQTTNTRALIHSNGWNDDGIFIRNGKFAALPSDSELRCDETIKPGKWYQYVISRDAAGAMRLYINGALCAHGTPDIPNYLKLNPDQIMFLADHGLRNPAGYVKRIRAFNTVLSEDKVARMCDCKLPGRDKRCRRHISMSPAASGLRFSSVWSPGFEHCAAQGGVCRCNGKVRYGIPNRWSNPIDVSGQVSCQDSVLGDPAVGYNKSCQCLAKMKSGKGYAAGRMNSKSAWSAGQNKIGEWMEVDTGAVQSISGVITQGRRDADQWVETFTLSVSEDGKEWRQVSCGRLFDGNVNRNTKVKNWFHEPVHARYIRFYPQTWRQHISMRAGVLVCERPCVGGLLDYKFSMSFMSTSLGPALEASWGEGEFNEMQVGDKKQMVYQFQPGEGLEVDEGRCLKSSLDWTILIDVALDGTTGYKRLLGSESWGDYGLYVNKYLILVPKNSNMMCKERIRKNKFYKFVMSRSKTGEVKLYINGALCAKGSPPYKDHFQLNPHNVIFFRDDAGEDAGGNLKNIRLWNKELPEKEVEAACECTKPDIGDKCKDNVIFNAPTSRTHYTSTWNNDKKGKGHGRGRIGSQQAWSAAKSEIGQYMQLDTGKVQTISGVVTQGRRDADQWVTSYTVHVSSDGADWRQVGCGIEFDANTDRKTKVKNYFDPPVKARYVRIIPQSWYGWVSMRAGLLMCEKPCKDGRLDYNFDNSFASASYGPSLDPAWGEGQFEGALGYRFEDGQGFELDASRCLKAPVGGWTMVMKARLDNVNGLRALMTSDAWADDQNGLYVDTFLRLAPSGANMVCDDRRIEPNKFYDFGMTRTKEGKITLYLDGAACAFGKPPFKDHYALDPKEMRFLTDNAEHTTAGYVKSIRVWGKTFDEYEVAAKCGCLLPKRAKSKCNLGLIPLTGNRKTTKYSSVLDNSPIGTGNAKGRLGSTNAWFAAKSEVGEWMQIDTGSVQTIAGVVTQGARNGNGWVTFFTVKVSDDGFQWKDVRCQWVFQGNSDASTRKKTLFNYPVVARFVRIYPTGWNQRIALRAGILICMLPCKKGELKYRLDLGNMLSMTQGPALEAAWGSGFFDGDNGYRFDAGKGLQVDQDEEGCMNDHKNVTKTNDAYTIFMSARLDQTNSFVRLVGSTGWGDNGLYIRGNLRLVGAHMNCQQIIKGKRWYQIGMTRDEEGNVALYVNGNKCASGAPSVLRGYQLDRNNIDFFHDDGSENAAGNVKELFVYNRALTPAEMAHESGCRLTKDAKKCKNTIVFRPQNSQTLYSSTFNKDPAGVGHGSGRLNSKQAWSPSNPNENNWMQIDAGEVRSIAGVVTQGRRDYPQWVTEFTVEISVDSNNWMPVQCGEEFLGNSDQMTKVKTVFRKPVLARFVRIFPKGWYGWPSMRAGLLICERKCVKGQLNYDFDGSFMSTTKGPSLDAPWGEGSWDNPSAGYRFNPGQGLVVDESNCINPSNFTVLITASLDATGGWRKLMGSDGWGEYGMYVNNQFSMFPASSMMKCDEFIQPNKFYTFMMTRKGDGIVNMYLNGYKCAYGMPPFVKGYEPSPTSLEFFHSDEDKNSAGYVKRIAIWDRVLSDEECAQESECKLADVTSKCNTTITLIPPYSRMKYSGTWANLPIAGECGAGRLGSFDAWCSRNNKIDEWVQIDTGSVRRIAGVVTQGRARWAQWVTSYKVMVSQDGVRWFDVQCGSVFQANTDMNTKVMNEFDRPVVGRFVRIFPQSFYNHMSMRAGILICEKACQGGQLDYQLLDDLTSETKGPELEAPWGYNEFSLDNGYRFQNNIGLSLDEATCIDGDDAWTIYFKAKLDFVHGWRRLIYSQGWGDDGLYIKDGKLTMFPLGAELQCGEYIIPNQFYKFAMTRSSKGEITLYINGYPCASGYPTYQKAYALNKHSVIFFRDDGSEYSNGWVKRIRLWDRALSPAELAKTAGCNIIDPQPVCKDSITYSPPYQFIKYSSVWDNNAVGFSHGKGRLNSIQAWSALRNQVGEWMQIDAGEVQPIAGIVTQGRRDCCSQWVTGYKVAVSVDGIKWAQIQCGMTFNGNSDASTKVVNMFDRPAKARYIRIYPQSWNNHMSMRAGLMLCEMPCKKDMLDYTFAGTFLSRTKGPGLDTPWGTGYFTDNDGYRFEVGQGLQLNEKNCIGDTWTVMINARLDSTSGWGRLMGSEPWGDFGLYVKENEYLMFPRSAGLRCQSSYIEPNRFYSFWLSRSPKGEIKIYINGYLCAAKSPALADHFALSPTDVSFFHDDGSENVAGFVKQITMWGKALSDAEIQSLSACTPTVDEKACERTVLYNPPYSNMVFSSVWDRNPVGWSHGTGRLDSYQGWSAGSNNLNQFMQIDTGKVQSIAGIVTQGRAYYWVQYVSAYAVEISADGENWQQVQCGTPFKGNTGIGPDRVYTKFEAPVKGRYVKIIPTSWYGHISMRAAVLLCEQPCQDDALDYGLQNSFMSSTDGPSLDAKWGEGTFDNGGYRFNPGQGLAVMQGTCLKNPKEYTIIIDAKLDNSWGWNRLLSADGWGRYGLFVQKGKYELYPEDLDIICPGKIFNGDVYKFGITRDNSGRMKLYLDGYMCAEGEPNDAPGKGLELNPDEVEFFRDPSNLHSSGTVSRIRMWGKLLTDKQMAVASGCKLPTPSDSQCKGVVVYNAPYSKIRYSDVLYNYPVGEGWGRGRLNSPLSWIAPYYGRGWWMQIDTGKLQSIAGVVTQGRGDGWWWTTSFYVSVSKDGRKWRKVECGRVFDGNTDYNTKVNTLFSVPLKARYVRIYPQESVGYPSLRAGVLICEEACENSHLDYRFESSFASVSNGPSLSPEWGEGRFDPNEGYRFDKGKGLKVDEHECVKNVKTWSALVEARFDETDKWRSIISADDWGGNGLFIAEGMLGTKPQDLACVEPIRPNYWYTFGMTRSEDGKVRLFINGFMCAEGSPSSPKEGFELVNDDIQFFKGNNGEESAGFTKRIEIWGSTLTRAQMASASGCSPPTETGACKGTNVLVVPDSSMRASSVWDNYPIGQGYGMGALNSDICWMSNWGTQGNKKEWLQVDTGKLQNVAGVVTRGANQRNWFTTTFKVKVSEDGRVWKWVECGRIFDGNTDWNTKVTNMFVNPVKARYVRFYPQTYYWYQAMRVAIVVCEADCKDKQLDFKLRQSFTSSTGGPELEAKNGEGYWTSNDGYRFDQGKGLQLDEQNCIKKEKAYTVLLRVRLDTVAGWRGLLTSKSWGENGLFVNDGRFQLRPTDLICSEEPIRANEWYKLGMTRSKDGEITISINGYPCSKGSPKSSGGFQLTEDDMDFVQGPEGQSSAGYVKRIQVWGKGFSDEEMQDLTGCRLATQSDDTCTGTVILNAPYSKIRASTIYAGHIINENYYYGRARLNAQGAWCANTIDNKQWLQIDSGKLQNIAGIVTEGRYYEWQWVTQYKVQVSKDALTWKDVECGRIFDGNSNYWEKVKNTFEKPVKARYVRINPVAWYNWISMRAGLLVCEGDCKDDTLKFNFNDELGSSTDGPSLKPEWGDGYYNKDLGYRVNPAQGLLLNQLPCIKDGAEYSILVDARLDSLDNWRQIIGSQDWGVSGAFAHDRVYSIKPDSVKCGELLYQQYMYRFGMTRSKKGITTLYLNGWKCAEGKVEVLDGLKLGKDMTFFKSEEDQNTGAWVKKIQVWGKTLDDEAMAKASGCVKPKEADECSSSMEYIVPYSKMSASSIRWGYGMGQGWGEAQLNAGACWAPYYYNEYQYLQMDLGKVTTVNGVRTQGDGGWYRWYFGGAWIQAYWIDVSNDGSSWTKVECGKIFQANTDSTTPVTVSFDKPVEARYVRIKPQSWYGWGCLRAAVMVCEETCKGKKLDYTFDNSLSSEDGGPPLSAPWGFAHYINNNVDKGYRFWHGYGLKVTGEDACIKNPKEYSVLMDVKLDSIPDKGSRALMSSTDWGDAGLYIDDQYLQLKPNFKLKCDTQKLIQGYYFKYGMTRSKDGTVTLFVNGNKCAAAKPTSNNGFEMNTKDLIFFRGSNNDQHTSGYVRRIQVWGKTLSNDDMLSESGCSPATVVSDKCDSLVANVKYSRMRFSSVAGGYSPGVTGYAKGRLNSDSGWWPGYAQDQWMQMDSGKVQPIVGVVTQGRFNSWYWVTKFRVDVSDDAVTWQQVECGRIFEGNADFTNKVKTHFSQPVKARYLRIYPLEWYNYPSMRAGLLLCENKCDSGHLDYTMDGLRSVTEGPALDAPWGEGQFVPQEEDRYCFYGYYDIAYHWITREPCQKMCEQNPSCSGYVVYSSGYPSCWLKSKMDQKYRWESQWYDSYFNTASLTYKTTAPVGYKFEQGKGLQLDLGNCIKDTKSYSVLVTAMLTNVDGWRKILSSSSWGDKGLFVRNSMLTMYPQASGLTCPGIVRPEYVSTFAITRSEDGEVKLFLNGYKCAEGFPSYADGYKLDDHDVSFFQDRDWNYMTAGVVRRIQLWDSTLSEDEMGKESGCRPATTYSVKCPRSTLFKPTAQQVDFSSIRNRDDIGQGYGQGWDLDGTGSFLPGLDKVGEWMQVDLGELRNVTSVVTKGNYHYDWKVTAFTVSVSKDGHEWDDVECGRMFETPYRGYWQRRDDAIESKFDRMVEARFLRLIITEWYGLPSIRMQVRYCDPPPAEVKKEEKKVTNTCKGKGNSEHCNPCKSSSDTKEGKDTTLDQCTGKDAPNKDLCQFEENKGCWPKSCKFKDWDCYITAFDSSAKAAMNVGLSDTHFTCGLYDYGAFRPMEGVSVKAKCNADIRCKHQAGCGCLARGQKCDTTAAPEGAPDAGSDEFDEVEDDGVRGVQATQPQVKAKAAPKFLHTDAMPEGEKSHVVDSNGGSANDEPVDESDPLGLIKAMDAKVVKGGKGGVKSGSIEHVHSGEHEHVVSHRPSQDAEPQEQMGDSQVHQGEQSVTQGSKEGGDMASIADVEKILEGGQKYLRAQAEGVREGVKRAAAQATKPTGGSDKEEGGDFDLSHLF